MSEPRDRSVHSRLKRQAEQLESLASESATRSSFSLNNAEEQELRDLVQFLRGNLDELRLANVQARLHDVEQILRDLKADLATRHEQGRPTRIIEAMVWEAENERGRVMASLSHVTQTPSRYLAFHHSGEPHRSLSPSDFRQYFQNLGPAHSPRFDPTESIYSHREERWQPYPLNEFELARSVHEGVRSEMASGTARLGLSPQFVPYDDEPELDYDSIEDSIAEHFQVLDRSRELEELWAEQASGSWEEVSQEEESQESNLTQHDDFDLEDESAEFDDEEFAELEAEDEFEEDLEDLELDDDEFADFDPEELDEDESMELDEEDLEFEEDELAELELEDEEDESLELEDYEDLESDEDELAELEIDIEDEDEEDLEIDEDELAELEIDIEDEDEDELEIDEDELAELDVDIEDEDEEDLEIDEDELAELEIDIEDEDEEDLEIDEDELAELEIDEEELAELEISDEELAELELDLDNAELDLERDETGEEPEAALEPEQESSMESVLLEGIASEELIGTPDLLGAPELEGDADNLFSGPASDTLSDDFFSGAAPTEVPPLEEDEDDLISDLETHLDEEEEEERLAPPSKEYRSTILEALRKVQHKGDAATTRADVLSVLESAVPKEYRAAVSERRRLVRLSCEYDVNCFQGNQIFHATIRDISLGGMKIEVARQLEAGSELQVSNPNRTENDPDERITAQVRWFRVKDDGKAEVGLQFVDPPEVLGRSWVVSLLNRVGMQSQAFNQRRYTRAVADFDIEVVDSSGELQPGRCVDLGLGGALIDTLPIFEQGDVLTFRSPSFGIHGKLEAEARVVNVKHQDDSYGRYAIEFENLDAATTKLLGRYVVDLLKLGRGYRHG